MSAPEAKDIPAAREFFPRGLFQPEGRFRFSVDALLLAAFARVKAGEAVLDMGTGCGVVALGILLRHAVRAAGLDNDPAMLQAAAANAELLGFSDAFRTLHLDVRHVRDAAELEPESFDAVTANPPYFRAGQGRTSPRGQRNRGLFEAEAELADFVRAAAYAVKNKGRVFMILTAERSAELISLLQEFRLEPKRMLPVYPAQDKVAHVVLLEAVKNGNPGLMVEPPLFLYREGCSVMTDAALRFCPFLSCNAGDRSSTSF